MPLLRKIGVIAAKLESTIGTDAGTAAADCNFLAYDPIIAPTIEIVDRPKIGTFDHNIASTGLMSGTATFSTDFIGNGSQTAPSWAETLLPACGFAQGTSGTSETFTASSLAPATAAHSVPRTVTIELYQNGRGMKLVGCVGDFNIVMETGKPVKCEWTFTGVLDAGTEASKQNIMEDIAVPTPSSLPTNKPFRSANAMTLAGSYNPYIQSATFASGNEVVLRECNVERAGYIAGIITGRTSTLSVNPEAALVAADDTYGDWLTMQEYATSITLEDGTDTVTIASAKCQTTSVSQSDRGGIVVDDMEIRYNTPPTIVFS
ncbi:hypothetical protein CMK18_23905 [Candidatus Poribacteria bacterium]|nr:hypothetical protein [Candidatus Poribacteria bacterium]